MNENDKFHHGFVQNELEMPPPVLQLVLLGHSVSKHKSLLSSCFLKISRGPMHKISYSNYILAKLIDWLTPTSNCFHVRHLFHCILYMCQVRHVRQATEPKTSIFKTPSSLRFVPYLSNMFSLFTLVPCLSRSLSWCLSFRLSQKVQAHFCKKHARQYPHVALPMHLPVICYTGVKVHIPLATKTYLQSSCWSSIFGLEGLLFPALVLLQDPKHL